MNNVLDILSELKDNGIFLSLDETQTNLKLKGSISSLSEDSKKTIKESKQNLIQFLKGNTNQFKNLIPRSEYASNRIELAPNQKGIWFHEKIEELRTAYIIPAIYFHELKDFKLDLFTKALNFLVEDNDVFRIVFGENEGKPFQKIKEHVDVENHFEYKKVANLKDIQDCIDIKSQTEFSATEHPIWDITVFELPESSYCFYLRLHHLIGDGESLSIFIQKLIEVYTRLQANADINKTEHLQYKDYVAWISEKDNFKSSSVFWKKEFLDYEENFKLIYDKTLKNQGETIGNTYIFEYSEQQTSKLRKWAVTNRVSLASLYTAATSIVLSKRGNSNDFVVGIPTASRNHPQLSHVIGNLVNTLPLRLQIDYTLDQRKYVLEIQNRYLSILEHQLYPFQYILEDIHYQRKVDENPLFNVMISVPNNLQTIVSENQIELVKKTSLYNLTFTFIELEKTIQLALEYSTSKFELSTIENIAKEIDTVFEQLINEKEKSLSEISLLTEPDRQFIIESSGSTNEIKLAQDLTVLNLLQQQVKQTPTNIAVCYDSDVYTYQEFYTSAISLAHYLKTKQKLQEGARVTLSIEKSIDQLISMYAIWFSGGICVPIDLNLPNERKALIIEDCEAQFCIDAQFIDTFKKQKAANDNRVELNSISPTSLSYILYTSGTTGKPKGVMITHQNLANKIQEETEVLAINQETVTYTLTNSSFDVSFLETVLPISKGGKVVIPKEEILIDTEKTISHIAKYQVTHLQGTPTYFSHFVSLLTDDCIKDLKHLRFICIGGESLNTYLVQQLKKCLPWVQLNNHYGPTEITIDAIVKQDISIFNKNIIGKPFGNVEGYVVDEFGNLLPIGVVGELVIGGSSVFSGYWGDEQLSKTKLKSVQFKTGTFYYTGDKVLLTVESEFEFIARKDTQIKLRGYRIELEEINQTLLKIDGVYQSISTVIENVLVSWVVSELDENLIKEQLRYYLPEYMVPQSIEIMESFPMTENGKIAMSLLPKHRNLQKEYVGPRTDLEAQLVNIWKEVLGVEQIGIYDNFFELGGHSLSLIRLKNTIERVFNKVVKFSDLYKKTTLSEQITLIIKYSTNSSKIQAVKKSPDYIVTKAQERIWVASQDEGSSVAHNIPSSFTIKGMLSFEFLKKAYELVIMRHEILRTSYFLDTDYKLRQKVLDIDLIDFNVEMIDFRSSNKTEKSIEIIELISNYTNKILDISKGKVLNVILIQLSESTYVLHQVLHHIAGDEWSLNVMTNDLLFAYSTMISGKTFDVFNPLEIQYKDFSVWETGLLAENGQTNEFWKNEFINPIPNLNLPIDFPNGINSNEGGEYYIHLNKTESDKLNRLKIHHQISNSGLFMSLLYVLFYKYTGNNDFLIGFISAQRNSHQIENQIGPYLNLMPVRLNYDIESDFNKLLGEVNNHIIDAINFSYYPFEYINEYIHPKSSNKIQIAVNIMNNINTASSILEEVKQLEFIPIESGYKSSKFPICIYVSEFNQLFTIKIEYKIKMFKHDRIMQLGEIFTRILNELLNNPEKKISTIELYNDLCLPNIIKLKR